MSALNKQVGGVHYKDKAIQPVQYIHANGLGYFEGCVVKYLTRWRSKNGITDLEKAKHYIELLIELERAAKPTPVVVTGTDGPVAAQGPAVTIGSGKWDTCGR